MQRTSCERSTGDIASSCSAVAISSSSRFLARRRSGGGTGGNARNRSFSQKKTGLFRIKQGHSHAAGRQSNEARRAGAERCEERVERVAEAKEAAWRVAEVQAFEASLTKQREEQTIAEARQVRVEDIPYP